MSLNTYLRLDFVKPGYVGYISVYKASILEAITTFGSISAAARVTKVKPQNLRRMAHEINEDFGEIIASKRGRSGGALVTAKGLALLQQFRTIEESVRRAVAEDLRKIEKLIGSDPQMPRPWFEYDRWRQLQPARLKMLNPVRAVRVPAADSTPLSVHVYLGLFSEKLWIGEGYIILLRAIEKYGSIGSAARATSWDYYNVRHKVKQMNQIPGGIVVTQRGRGGGATLSPRGVELTDRFCEIRHGIHRKLSRELAFAAHLANGDNPGRNLYPDYAPLIRLREELL